jgi:hypothetical protein
LSSILVLSIYLCIYRLENSNFLKVPEFCLSLSWGIKIERNSYLHTYSTRKAFFIRSINFESAIITYAFLLDRSISKVPGFCLSISLS